MRFILRILGTLSFLGLLAASLAPANAMEIQLNGKDHYLCVAVERGKTANGTPVLAASCSGGPESRWNYVDGQLQGIGTANGASMCLDVVGQGVTAGTPVDLWPCGTQQNQQWEIQSGLIVGVQSGMCLDSSGGPKVGSATQLVINPCIGAASQIWITRSMQLQLSGSFPYLCANVQANKTADGTPVLAYSCNGAPNELWNYKSDHQFYGLGTDNGHSKCLTASGITAGSLVSLSSCTDSQEQTWIMFNGTLSGFPASNQVVLEVPGGLCLDSSGGPIVGSSTQLIVNTCTGAASQNWIVR
jgi:hypothetical protein